jgi:ABC-type cobalamin/Fe3+-siderophores transport system ATPase subunit
VEREGAQRMRCSGPGSRTCCRTKTPILLLDELITHLDRVHQLRMLSSLRALVSDGRTVLAILHDPTLAILFGNEFLCLRDGLLQPKLTASEISDTRLRLLESIHGVRLESVPLPRGGAIVPRLW